MNVLVTGAGGAIGGAIVARLLADGHAVVAHDVRPESLASLGAGVVAIAGDLAHPAGLSAALAERGIRLDAVIAAHGVDGSGALGQVDDAFVRRVLAINAASVPALLRATRDRLRDGAAFVVVGSQAGIVGEADNVAYCASKFAVHGWARSVAASTAGVRVRVLAPGCTETPLLYAAQERFAAAQGVAGDVFLARRRAGIPIERFAAVEETAAAAVYLADPVAERPFLLAATGGEVLA